MTGTTQHDKKNRWYAVVVLGSFIVGMPYFMAANVYGASDINSPCQKWLYSEILSTLENGGDFEGDALGFIVMRLLLEVDAEFTTNLISTASKNQHVTFLVGQSITANCTLEKSAKQVALDSIAEGRKLLK